MKKTYTFIITLLALCTLVVSCRDGYPLVDETEEDIIQGGTATNPGSTTPENGRRPAWGMYLLCEGNYGSNRTAVDYLDLGAEDGQLHYLTNLYPSRNPDVVKELGDMGSDIQVYGSRLWIVVNNSNKVEVCDAATCRRLGQVDIANCRYVAFHDGYAYVSSFAGPVTIGSGQQGVVHKIDTLTLQTVATVMVGRQPEEMAVIGNTLYVANSGGYTPDNYERTVSVIDLTTMTETGRIDVDINLHRLRADGRGQLWVSTRGDYASIPSRLYCLAPDAGGAMSVRAMVDVPVSEICVAGDSLYYIGVTWSAVTQSNNVAMGVVDVRTCATLETDLFSSPEIKAMQMPYGIIVNPTDRDFYLMDAKNFVTSGELLHFLPDGTFDWRQRTSDVPSRAAFLY